MKRSPFAFLVDHFDETSLTKREDRFFYQALGHARSVLGTTHPNPSVGAIIAKNDRIIAFGFTQPIGGNHAEKNAITHSYESLLDATLYVTLEPCSHFGRTPPCTDAIIEAKIKRVIYGVLDPNPQVLGQGLARLNKSFIETKSIEHPRLQEMATAQIVPFKTWIIKKRPYVVLKIVTSSDNKISTGPHHRNKISGYESDVIIHQLRSKNDAILIGANTARVDNPKLTARIGHNLSHQPTRVVMSRDLTFSNDLFLWDISLAKTIVITEPNAAATQKESLMSRGVQLVSCAVKNSQLDLNDAFNSLGTLGFTSVLVEPGQKLFSSMLTAPLVDEIWWFKSGEKIGGHGLDLNFDEEKLMGCGFMPASTYALGGDRLAIFMKS